MSLESTNDWTIKNLKVHPRENDYRITFDHYKGANYRNSVEFIVSPDDYENDFDRIKIENSNMAKSEWLLSKAEDQNG